jgi:hypothetical protein
MCFDGSDGSEIEASNVAGSNRPALGVADGREWISILNTSIEQLIGETKFEDLKLPG